MATVSSLLLEYLAAPERRQEFAERLSTRPGAALTAILRFRGPYPKGIHPIDVHEEYLQPLLTALLKRCPELLTAPNRAPITRRPPSLLIVAATEANDPLFADTILAGLKDRSIETKLTAAWAISSRAFLRTPEVKDQLEQLLRVKSIASNSFTSSRIQEALSAFE